MTTSEKKYDVLIVDDTPENLTVLREILTEQDYHVRPAISGDLALKAIQAENPDLVLLDIMMPGMDGFEVCRKMKKHPDTKEIPVIFISALSETEDKVAGFAAGGVDYITKPFQKAEVLARVRTHLTLSKLQEKTKLQNKLLQKEIEDRKVAERALEKANNDLEKLACLDGLTGVANRRHFDITLEREWKRLSRSSEPLSLILCDIDYFKKYNDDFGHIEGDKCLQKVSLAISSVIRRPADLAARYGGEEFAVLIPGADGPGAGVVAEEIRLAVLELEIPHPSSSVAPIVSVSIGAATMTPEHGIPSEKIVSAADKLLYTAKNKGRNVYISDEKISSHKEDFTDQIQS